MCDLFETTALMFGSKAIFVRKINRQGSVLRSSTSTEAGNDSTWLRLADAAGQSRGCVWCVVWESQRPWFFRKYPCIDMSRIFVEFRTCRVIWIACLDMSADVRDFGERPVLIWKRSLRTAAILGQMAGTFIKDQRQIALSQFWEKYYRCLDEK